MRLRYGAYVACLARLHPSRDQIPNRTLVVSHGASRLSNIFVEFCKTAAAIKSSNWKGSTLARDKAVKSRIKTGRAACQGCVSDRWRRQVSIYRDEGWPKLLSYWGLPNLQMINRDVHILAIEPSISEVRKVDGTVGYRP
jgi:hypothetical protein